MPSIWHNRCSLSLKGNLPCLNQALPRGQRSSVSLCLYYYWKYFNFFPSAHMKCDVLWLHLLHYWIGGKKYNSCYIVLMILSITMKMSTKISQLLKVMAQNTLDWKGNSCFLACPLLWDQIHYHMIVLVKHLLMAGGKSVLESAKPTTLYTKYTIVKVNDDVTCIMDYEDSNYLGHIGFYGMHLDSLILIDSKDDLQYISW